MIMCRLERSRRNIKSTEIKGSMMVGANNDDIFGNIRTIVRFPQRMNVMSF